MAMDTITDPKIPNNNNSMNSIWIINNYIINSIISKINNRIKQDIKLQQINTSLIGIGVAVYIDLLMAITSYKPRKKNIYEEIMMQTKMPKQREKQREKKDRWRIRIDQIRTPMDILATMQHMQIIIMLAITIETM